MESTMDWNDLRFFLAVASTRSLSGASAQLGVSPSTVSRRVGALEAALQLRLFRPRPDGYDLTEAGLKLLPAAERAEAQMRLFERGAREKEGDLAGPIRIEAPELLGQDVVLPVLAEFIESHPAIRVELRSSVGPVRLAGEEADIVLRLVRPEQGRYRQRRVGHISFGLYASTPLRLTGAHRAARRTQLR
jgi:DNA-binding transcriptional LysR family regulator